MRNEPRADGPERERAPSMADEQNVYAAVYYVLLAGMAVSSALYAAGIVLALLHPHYVPLTPAWIRGHYDWPVFIGGLRTLNPAAIMMVATLVLILTPVARVLVSIYAFYVDHDRKYVAVTSLVFLVIVLTVVLGRFGLK